MDNNQKNQNKQGRPNIDKQMDAVEKNPEEFMIHMQNAAKKNAQREEMSRPYAHKKLRKGLNVDYYDNVWDDNAALDYTQGVLQRDPDAKVAKLQKDRDPRTFEAEQQHNLSYEMRAFFRQDLLPKGYGLDSKSSHYDKLMALLRSAPEREPDNASYLHDTLSNPRWDFDQRHQALQALMEYNFDPNREWNSEFAIERVARMGDVRSAATLLQYGAHVHVQDKRGFNLLSSAIENGHHDMIPLLARYGVEPKNTAAGDSPVMLAILRLKADVKANPEKAYTSFYKTVGNLHTYGLYNPNRKNGEPLIDPSSAEYRELEAIRKDVGHDHKQMFQTLTANLDKLEVLSEEHRHALRASAPKRIAPFTNEGGVQSTPKSFALSPKGLRDRLARKAAGKIMDGLYEALDDCKTDDDFKRYQRGSKFGKDSFFDGAIPKHRDILNLDRPHDKAPHDTIVHKAARIGSPAMLDFCMRENCNLHVVNTDGDYPLHVVAKLDDPRVLKEMLSKMVGSVNPATGKRESLYDNGKIADMHALNADGETFLEVVARVHSKEFAMEVAEHLQLGRDPHADISRDLALLSRPDLRPLNELRLTPVLPLTTDVLGAHYIGIDPLGPVPPVVKSSDNETPEELRALNKRREDDIYKITAMLDSPDASEERKSELRTALKSTLATMPVAARVAIMNNAMDKINENLVSDPERKGAQDLNALRRGVYLRMASDLAQTMKDPAQAEKAILEMDLHTPEGKPNGIRIAAAIAAVEGDSDAMDLTQKIHYYAEMANRARFENDPKYKGWYNEVDPGNSSQSPSPDKPS